MLDLRRVARVLQAAGQPVGQVQTVLDLPEYQKAAIEGQGAAVEADIERLGAHRGQTGQAGHRINHGGWAADSGGGRAWSPKPTQIQPLTLPPLTPMHNTG